jgi:hypothetical protein
MTAPKRVRWNCPNGCPGILASTRPPKDSVERYCLPCSAKIGRLVLRVAPALERKRAAAAVSSAAKAKSKRATAARARQRAKDAETERYTVDGVDLRDEMKRLLKLRAFGGRQGRLHRRPPELRISRRSWTPGRLGFAEPWRNRITLATYPGQSLADARETLVHELTHIASGQEPGSANWHGPRFRKMLTAAMKEAYKVTTRGVRTNRYHGKYAAALERQEAAEAAAEPQQCRSGN